MKRYLSCLAAVAASLCLAHIASAQTGSGVTVSLALASGNPAQLTPGSLLTYNLNVSGLKGSTSNPGSPVVGGYDLTVDFNPSFLSATGFSFGPYLGPGDTQFDDLTSTAGQAYLGDFASASAQTLIAQQPAAFTLATLTFTVMQAGNSVLTFDPSSSMSSENGTTLDVVAYRGTVVPEPSTCVLALLGLAGLAWSGARRRANVA